MKIKGWFIMCVICIGIYVWKQIQINNLQDQVADLVFVNDSVVQFSDSLKGILATSSKPTTSAEETADDLHADVISSTAITLRPDTVHRDSLLVKVDTIFSDSTRLATLYDSTKAGVLKGELEIPPCCNLEIRLNYTFIPAPVNFELSVLRLQNNDVFFLLQYSGGRSELSVAYADIPKKRKMIQPYIGGGYAVGSAIFASTGVDLNIGPISLYAEGQHIFTEQGDSYGFIGIRRRF